MARTVRLLEQCDADIANSPVLAPIDITHSTPKDVREDTAALASFAMPDVASQQPSSSYGDRHPPPASGWSEVDPSSGRLRDKNVLSPERSNDSSRPEVILEVSEPTSPKSVSSAQPSPSSALSDLFRQPMEESSDLDEASVSDTKGPPPAVVGEGIISQPSERTTLLLKKAALGFENKGAPVYGSTQDVEGQNLPGETLCITTRRTVMNTLEEGVTFCRGILSPKSWDKRAVWVHGLREPANYIPSVVLGLLLNILDALSYGNEPYAPKVRIVLICPRYDPLSLGSTHIRRSWGRRDFDVLRKLHRVTAGIFPRW